MYDGFNRRISTCYTPKVNGTQTTAQQVEERSWYDPGVEFLEVAIEVWKATTNSTGRWWKVHGPDLTGSYGGLTNTLCAPIMEHHEDGNRSRPKESLHQPSEVDWSGRRDCHHTKGESYCPAHS